MNARNLMQKGKVTAYKVIRKIYRKYLELFTKVDGKQILLFSCPNYSDNAYSMFQYFQSNEKFADYKFVWLFENKSAMPKKVIKKNTEYVRCQMDWCNGFTLKAMKKIAQSKYVFYTHYSPTRYVSTMGQKVVNLWHGCGYKAVEKQATGQVHFDIALVPGPVFVDTKSEFWSCEKEKVVPIGYPRYDTIFRPSKKGQQFMDSIRKGNDKLILWMPTFRNTATDWFPENKMERAFDLPLLTGMEDVEELNTYCKEHSIMLCIKRHRNQLQYQCEANEYSNITFVNDADLIQSGTELYSLFQYTDGLVTDYSSISIDYMLLNKPIAFALDDYEQYKSVRGFVFENPLDYMPGEYLYEYKDLLKFLVDVGEGIDAHEEKRKTLMPEVHNPCDGYCARVWNYVEEM